MKEGYAGQVRTHPPNWHGLVVADVLLNHLTTGLFVVAAVGDLADPGGFRAAASWAYPLALLFLLADLATLVLDLGDPLRFHHMLRVFKPGSPMSLGTWCLTAYSLPVTGLAALEVALKMGVIADAPWAGWLRWVMLVVGLPAAFGSAAYKGVLFSVTAQPGWRDARWLGAYFVATGLALGAGMCAVLGAPTRTAFALLVLVHAVPLCLVVRVLAAAGGWSRLPGLAVALGVALPLALLVAGREAGFTGAAVGSLFAGAWLVRHDLVFLPHRLAGRH